MADGDQGLLSTIGSGLSAALPFAIPAGLGAGLGAMSHLGTGATIGGGLAGAAEAMGESSKAQMQQRELAMKEQALHMEAQKTDIEVKKGQIALQNEAEKDKYKNSITDAMAAKMGLDKATAQQMYNDDPKLYFDYMEWGGITNSVGKHPDMEARLKAAGLSVDDLNAMPLDMRKKAWESIVTGKAVNGHSIKHNADGTDTMVFLGPVGPDGRPTQTETPWGVTQKLIATPERPMTAPQTSADVREWIKENPPPGPLKQWAASWSKGLVGDTAKSWKQQAIDHYKVGHPDATDAEAETAFREGIAKLGETPATTAEAPAPKAKGGGLPPTKGVPEGTRKFNKRTGKYIILKGGKWVPDPNGTLAAKRNVTLEPSG